MDEQNIESQFELLKGVKVSLNKVTPRRLKELQALGVDVYSEPSLLSNNIYKVYKDDDPFKRFMNAIFDKEFSDDEILDVDMEEVNRGFLDFITRAR